MNGFRFSTLGVIFWVLLFLCVFSVTTSLAGEATIFPLGGKIYVIPTPKKGPPPGYGLVISAGQVWLDRNLGASRAAVKSTDHSAYGDLYQWGRLMDGHEKRNSQTTSQRSETDIPGHDKFIRFYDGLASDWRVTPNNNLWAGRWGKNNPCVDGFRLPTKAEFETEMASWSSPDARGAFNSPLKLTMAGFRNNKYGLLEGVSSFAVYWTSTTTDAGAGSAGLTFSSGMAAIHDAYVRSNGFSVRCIQD